MGSMAFSYRLAKNSLGRCLGSRAELATHISLVLTLLDDEGVHHVDGGLEIVADECRVGVVRRLLDVLVHLGAKLNLHVHDVPSLLDLGPKTHGLVSGLGKLLAVAEDDKDHAPKGLAPLHTLAKDDGDFLNNMCNVTVQEEGELIDEDVM